MGDGEVDPVEVVDEDAEAQEHCNSPASARDVFRCIGQRRSPILLGLQFLAVSSVQQVSRQLDSRGKLLYL